MYHADFGPEPLFVIPGCLISSVQESIALTIAQMCNVQQGVAENLTVPFWGK
jgi:hypothetical protein